MAAEAIAPISVTRGECGRAASAGDRTTLGEVVTDAIVACLVQRRAPLPEIGHHAEVDVGTVLDQIGHGVDVTGAGRVDQRGFVVGDDAVDVGPGADQTLDDRQMTATCRRDQRIAIAARGQVGLRAEHEQGVDHRQFALLGGDDQRGAVATDLRIHGNPRLDQLLHAGDVAVAGRAEQLLGVRRDGTRRSGGFVLCNDDRVAQPRRSGHGDTNMRDQRNRTQCAPAEARCPAG